LVLGSRFTVRSLGFEVGSLRLAVCRWGAGYSKDCYGSVGVVKMGLMRPMGLMGSFGHSYDFLDRGMVFTGFDHEIGDVGS